MTSADSSTASDLSISSLFNVKGKIVLITGGGSGIGKMMAEGFAQNGAKVYIAARKEKQLQEAVEDINKKAVIEAHYIVGNINSKAGCNALISEFKKLESKLHVLINNSGITWGGAYEDFPEEKGWDNVFNVNVKSIFYMTAGLTDLMIKDSNSFDPARVINVSSTAAFDPHVETALSSEGNGTWSYNTSKAAVNHLTSSLAVSLGPKHITVNAICPGLFPSKMTAFGFKSIGSEAFEASQPTGRYGMPQDMAGMALFLSSPGSAHVTGTQIPLDGGARFMGMSITPTTKL